jgi:RNA polymerase sigma-54 factor
LDRKAVTKHAGVISRLAAVQDNLSFRKKMVNEIFSKIVARATWANAFKEAHKIEWAKTMTDRLLCMLRNVQQRFETILRVSQAIVSRQQGFFDHGEVAMRPLVLREIAEALDLHESTVSRVTTQKYMMTPRGLFELKFFFGSHVATEGGGAASSTAIRALIRQLVGNENSRQPLSDSQLADILGRQGIIVARRTVAKYRESLQIPAVSLRKSL